VPVIVPDSVPQVPHDLEVEEVDEHVPSVQLVSVSVTFLVSYTQAVDPVDAVL
jgi:hypothetical protein